MSINSQWLRFQVGCQHILLPMWQVEHILTIDNIKNSIVSPQVDQEFLRIKTEEIPWLPLWRVLGEKSIYSDLESLIKILPQRRQDHLDWINALEQSLLHDLAFTKARDPRECAFGKWYYAFQSENLGLKALLATFKEPHARIHQLADKLLGMVAQGQREEALYILQKEKADTLAGLLTSFDELQATLPRMIRIVALIVNNGSLRCAIGVDKIVEISRSSHKAIDEGRSQYDTLFGCGFINLSDSELPLPVLNINRLLLLNTASG